MDKRTNKRTNKNIITLLFILILILIVGTSYALWQLTLRQARTNVITTGCFKLEFQDENPINLQEVLPISDEEGKKLTPYQVTITNICNKEVDYYINLETLNTENPLAEEYLRASLTASDNDNANKELFSDTLKDEYKTAKRVIEDSTKAFMLESGTLLEKESKTFYLRLWLDEDTPLNDTTINKTYQGKVTVTTTYVPDLVVKNMMIPMSVVNRNMMPAKNNTYTQNDKYKLSKISFENRVTSLENVAEVVDFSVDGDNSVQGYYVKDNPEIEDSRYTLHIQANGKIQVNSNGYAYFSMPDDSEVTFVGIENIDTSNVSNMSYMFYKYNGENLDLSGFNTRNVTTMQSMFYNCSNLVSLNISSFKTSKVTTMYYMFYNCSSLTSLDVSRFDTSNVTNMASMFFRCSSLTSLDVSRFDTSKVTKMNHMFCLCSSLTILDVSRFDTSNVTNMASMFSGCSNLTSLDVSNFDTSQVTAMSNMFDRCSSLTILDVSQFNTSKVTIMDYMFLDCSSLKNLDLSNFDTSQVTNMRGMFSGCLVLTTTITIKNSTVTFLENIVTNAATEGEAKITFNYTNDTSNLVDAIISSKPAASNVVKGVLVSE